MKNFMNIYVLAILLVATGLLGFSNSAFADMEAKLATSDGSDAFVIWNSSDVRLMSIFSNGNVGIGTTTSTARLHVEGTGGEQLRVTATDGGGSARLTLYGQGDASSFVVGKHSGGVAFVWNDANTALQFGTNSLERMIITNSGNVGIGTTSPLVKLQVMDTIGRMIIGSLDSQVTAAGEKIGELLFRTSDALSGQSDENRNPASIAAVSEDQYSGSFMPTGLAFYTTNLGFDGKAERVRIDKSGNVGIGTTSPNYPLEMGSGAHVTSGGVWTNASSREYKENIRDLTVDEAMQALDELRPSRFNYKVDNDDEYVGFIAEDVPELVATKDRKGLSPMDITAVLTKVAQEQQNQLIQQQNRLLMQGEMLQKQQDNMSEMKHELEMLKSSKSQTKKGA